MARQPGHMAWPNMSAQRIVVARPSTKRLLRALQWEPGLEGAITKLDSFLGRSLPLFQHDRAKVDRESTSQLSPWIHQGTLSVRYIYYRVRPPPP
jgi:deoxyribodipyrimidine photolyase